MQPVIGALSRTIRPRVGRRTAIVGLVLLLLLLAYLALSYVLALSVAPLQFTQFLGTDPPELSVMAGPQGTVTYQLTLTNKDIIPIQVTKVEPVPGQPLTPVAVQLMPDDCCSAAAAFRPFTLPPLESIYLLVTSPTVCGARQESLRVRYSILGMGRASTISFGGQIVVSKFRCPWVGS